MKHHKKQRTLGRKRNQRRALLRTLASGLIRAEKIQTTEAKAKELRPYIEKLITEGKKETLAARRNINAKIGPKNGKILVEKIVPKYTDRKGGYTRILKMPARKTDGSKMAVIAFV